MLSRGDPASSSCFIESCLRTDMGIIGAHVRARLCALGELACVPRKRCSLRFSASFFSVSVCSDRKRNNRRCRPTGSVYSNQLRLQTDVHPNGRTIYYDYGSPSGLTAAYSTTSTIREIWDGSPSGIGLGLYDYNGAGSKLALATYPQPSFRLDHFEGTSGTYAGLDRFGRVVDQYWKGFSGTSDVDRTHYAYDYVGRRIYRQIDTTIYPTDNRDQAYTYDRLNRLLTSQVGSLSGTTISGTPASEGDWTLDGLGNWPGYVQKTAGTTSLNQTRTASPANEISAISATVGTTWATPAYDLAGNMTSIPTPTNLTSLYTATYDAWNRLVSLSRVGPPRSRPTPTTVSIDESSRESTSAARWTITSTRISTRTGRSSKSAKKSAARSTAILLNSTSGIPFTSTRPSCETTTPPRLVRRPSTTTPSTLTTTSLLRPAVRPLLSNAIIIHRMAPSRS